MRTAAVLYVLLMCFRALSTSAALRSRSLAEPTAVRSGSSTFWFLRMVFADRLVRPSSSQSSAALRTV